MIQSKTKVQTSDRIQEDQMGTSGQVDRQGHQKVRSLSPNDVKHWSTLCLDTSSRDDGLHLGFWSLSTKTGDTDRMWHHRGSGYRKWSDLSSDLRQAAAGVSTSHLLTFPGTRCSELTQEMKTTPDRMRFDSQPASVGGSQSWEQAPLQHSIFILIVIFSVPQRLDMSTLQWLTCSDAFVEVTAPLRNRRHRGGHSDFSTNKNQADEWRCLWPGWTRSYQAGLDETVLHHQHLLQAQGRPQLQLPEGHLQRRGRHFGQCLEDETQGGENRVKTLQFFSYESKRVGVYGVRSATFLHHETMISDLWCNSR